MEEHEKALISRQFIEVMLKVPVILCPGRIEAIETKHQRILSGFHQKQLPLFHNPFHGGVLTDGNPVSHNGFYKSSF